MKKARPELPVVLITGRHEIADQDRAQALLAVVGDAIRDREREEEHGS